MRRRNRVVLLSLVALGILAGAAYATKLVHMVRHEEAYWFRPAGEEIGNWTPIDLEFEDAWFTSADGTRLHGWFVPHENPRAVVLFNHGSGGNITHRDHRLRQLHALGAAVLCYDYRGFGRSGGSLGGEEGLLADARAARAWLASHTGVSETDIVQFGRSLGGGIAVDLAAKDGARGLLLEATFTSLPEVAAHHYWWAPVQQYMTYRLKSIDKIGDYEGPMLQSHGGADDVVPLEQARRLFEAAGSEPKRFIVFDGAVHETDPPDSYTEELDRFFGSLPEPASDDAP